VEFEEIMMERLMKTMLALTTRANFLDGTLAEAKATIERMIANYGENAEIEYMPNDLGDDSIFFIRIKRPETDEEMADRVRREENALAQKRDREWKTYLELKAKFEGKGS
jgi:outer membrane protein assembly factor BamD (BamD/ComL family)